MKTNRAYYKPLWHVLQDGIVSNDICLDAFVDNNDNIIKEFGYNNLNYTNEFERINAKFDYKKNNWYIEYKESN